MIINAKLSAISVTLSNFNRSKSTAFEVNLFLKTVLQIEISDKLESVVETSRFNLANFV